MKELGIWEPLAVKLQTYKTAVEVRFPSAAGPRAGTSLETSVLGSILKGGLRRQRVLRRSRERPSLYPPLAHAESKVTPQDVALAEGELHFPCQARSG